MKLVTTHTTKYLPSFILAKVALLSFAIVINLMKVKVSFATNLKTLKIAEF